MAFLAQIVDGVIANKFNINHGDTTIGRSPNNTIVINDSTVSGLHAVLTAIKNEDFKDFTDYELKDAKSTNGVFVNDARVEGSTPLRNGDGIRIAWTQFVFYDESQSTKLDMTVHLLEGENI